MNSDMVAQRIRAFNRLYTETIGALNDKHEGSSVSLVESRMLFTIASTDNPQATKLARALGLDLPYTSRVLTALEDRRLVRRTLSKVDRRERLVELTGTGKRTLAKIEQRSNERALALTAGLSDAAVTTLLRAMDTISHLITQQEQS